MDQLDIRCQIMRLKRRDNLAELERRNLFIAQVLRS